jgi:hypothetical protein
VTPSMTYDNGFEDATELCLTEIEQAKTKIQAEKRLEYILSLVKESKLEKVKQMLGIL